MGMASGDQILLESILDFQIRAVHPAIMAWEQSMVKANLESALLDAWNSILDIRTAYEYKNHFPVAGTTNEDYADKVFRLDRTGVAIAGIRFSNLDITKPFIEVTHRNFLIDSDLCEKLVDEIRDCFEAFSPKYIRFYGWDSGEFSYFSQGHYGKQYFAGALEALQERELPPHYDELVLSHPSDFSFYPYFHEEYLRLLTDRPNLSEAIRPESKSDLEEYGREGLLFVASIGSTFSGVVAGMRGAAVGMSGVCITEEFLTSSFRGRGYGPSLQRHFIEIGPKKEDKVVFGTIHPKNVPAIRTAINIGRINVGGYYWLPLQ